MNRRVAIVDVAQLAGPESADNFYDQAYRVTREVLDKAGLNREQVGTVVSAASDIFHGGISCANAYYWESVGSFLKNGTRQDGESLLAFYYAAIRILSGQYDTALAVALCKGSENPENDTLTHFYTDPFYQRPVGLNETVAAALQMRLYMERYGVTPEQCAAVSVKNLGNAMQNPKAHRRGRFSVDDVLGSPVTADPLTELQCAPRSEGMVAVLLASEETARKLTSSPVWLEGYGCALDTFFLGDRNLLKSQLCKAASNAYDMAGIRNPRAEIDVAEISEPYAFQELLWCEQLGFCDAGKGAQLLASGATAMDGDLPVNPSGGVLATNAYVSRGLQRVAESALQLKGAAGAHQIPGRPEKALAHGVHGFAGQCHVVAILGRD